MKPFVHPQGICESTHVGQGTRIWAFAHVLPGARIGQDCNICDHTFIENDVVLGDRVTIKCGVQLWDGVRLEDDVFVGPNVTFTNDPFPRSKIYPETFLQTVVSQKASIGANTTVLPGITIGRNAMVGAGAVVTRSVPPNAIVIGNPARIVGYVDSKDIPQKPLVETPVMPLGAQPTKVPGVTLYRFPVAFDMRGKLTAVEFESQMPFKPLRCFFVYDVPTAEVRGEHAHKECHQLLICIKGSCAVVADDGKTRQEIILDNPFTGIHLPPLVWGIQYRYSADAVLMVLASQPYRNDDYIRNYDEFLIIRHNFDFHTKT